MSTPLTVDPRLHASWKRVLPAEFQGPVNRLLAERGQEPIDWSLD